ncbi:dorsal-ventral patterning protein tolloid-like [Oculina patagonica]
MIVIFGLCTVLFRTLASTEGCIANQKTTEFLTRTEGTIEPRSPVSWEVPYNAICQWTITAPKGKVLRIWLLSFSLKSDDYLRIHDGPNEGSKMVAQYNSFRYEGTYFISSGRSLCLKLKTGLKVTDYRSRSLTITYEALDRQECSLNTTLDAPVAQYLFDEKRLTTPYYPQGYRINTTCGWYIRAPEYHVIVLEYGYFSFCTDDISSEDSLRIYDVQGSELRPIRRFRRKWDISVSPLVYISFKSDDQLDKIHDEGLCLYYMATKATSESDCFLNSTLEAPLSPLTSNISIPYWPPGYRGMNNTCGWYIKAPVNHLVKLDFVLTWKQQSENSVQVYDVEGSELSPITLTWYNWILSKFRSVYILFKRQNETSVRHQGISIEYTAIKSGNIRTHPLRN